MGTQTKIIMLAILIGVTGCEHRNNEPPVITVNERDSSVLTRITITHHNLYYSNREEPHIILSNPEEVAAYREQIEFLLKRLDETERRMNIHEPELVE